MKKSVITSILALGMLAGLPSSAMATCVNSSTLQERVIPLQIANITVARDLPLGSRFYRQEFSANLSNRFACTSPSGRVTFEVRSRWVAGAMRLSSWNTGPLAGKVYESGVPGIGVAFFSGAGFLPLTTGAPTTVCPNTSTCHVQLQEISTILVELVKISDVVGSGVISANSFLPFEAYVYQDGAAYPYLRTTFSASITVVSRTCQTPNVAVNMGVEKVSAFSPANNATPWKDFSITLNNCPAFTGTYPRGDGSWMLNGNTSGISEVRIKPQQKTSLQVNLTGTVPPINAGSGILALNSAQPGSASVAKGVGIQLANTSGTPVQIGPGTLIPSGAVTQALEGASYTIPLKARYIKTTGPVGPGSGECDGGVHDQLSITQTLCLLEIN
jgi:type 1 fimbria pilin